MSTHSIFRTPIEHVEKVLVVDDHKMLCNVMVKMFRMLGIAHIKTAHSGLNALKIIPEFKPDIVFTDLEMAPVSGIELLKAIRCGVNGCDPYQAVVMLTARISHQVTSCAVELDLDYMMSKPPFKILLGDVVDLVRRRLMPVRLREYYEVVNIGVIGMKLDLDNISYQRPDNSSEMSNSISSPNDRALSINEGIKEFRREYSAFLSLRNRVMAGNGKNLSPEKISSYIVELEKIALTHFSTQEPFIHQYDTQAKAHLHDHEILLSMIKNLEVNQKVFQLESSDELLELIDAFNNEHYKKYDHPLNKVLLEQLSSS